MITLRQRQVKRDMNRIIINKDETKLFSHSDNWEESDLFGLKGRMSSLSFPWKVTIKMALAIHSASRQ